MSSTERRADATRRRGARDTAGVSIKILERYVASAVLVTFLVSLVFITFALTVGSMMKLTDLLARGVPWLPVFRIFVNLVPLTIMTAIPLGALVSCLLVFGRLSDDGEIMAMRTLGLSMAQIVRGTILLAVVLSMLGLYINHEVEPRAHLARRTEQAALETLSPLDVIEEGRFFHAVRGVTMYVGRKRGNRLTDVRIFDARQPGVTREIRARRADVRVIEGRDVAMWLHDVRIDPFSPEVPHPVFMERWTFELPRVGRQHRYRRNHQNMVFRELVDEWMNVDSIYGMLGPRDRALQRMVLAFELSRRSAMALSCLAFVLIGMPLGIRAHRRSTGLGVVLALLLFFFYYMVTLLANSLVRFPAARGDIVIWVPVVLFSAVGILLMARRG